MTSTRGKPLPTPTPETAPYWEGCKQHELRLPYCTECREYFFYPRRYCPTCLSDAIEWRPVSGKGTLHTYVISARPAPGFENETPYVIAVVKLDEGPHLMSNIVNVEVKPENLPADLPVEVVFDDVSDSITIPRFQPVGAGRRA
ncbi:MAG: Zn-ribbon domain-containing OB-fold protein [Dehalococcoidia bacterium]